MSVVEAIRGAVRPHRGRVAAATLLALVQALVLLPVPILLGYAFDTALPEGRKGLIVGIAAAMAGLVVVSGLMQVASTWIQIWIATRVGRDLRVSLYRRLFDAPRDLFDKSQVATLHDRIVHDSQRSIDLFGVVLNSLLPDIVLSVGVGAILFVLNWRLALVTMAFVPILLIVSRFMMKRQVPAVHRYHDTFRDFSSGVMRVIRSQDMLRVAGAESRELEAAETDLEALRSARSRYERVLAAHRVSQQTTVGVAGAVLLVSGGFVVIGGSMTLGELLAFYAAFAMLRGPAGSIAAAYGLLVAGWQAYARVIEFLDDPVQRPYQGTTRIDVRGHLVATDLAFGYDPEHPVVEGVSITLEPGKVTALIGPNGSGKSTVVNLLLGFYAPDRGTVCIEGVPMKEIDLHHARAQLGVVRQEPFLLPGTVLDNITYGADADPDALERALRLSGADGVIADLPRGLETVVGDDGQLLSGGQRQRIALARALLGDPRILILDEPTNHLDERAIARLIERLDELRESMAVLIISHQRSVRELADAVVDLDADEPDPLRV